jgi:RAD54-like protein 2
MFYLLQRKTSVMEAEDNFSDDSINMDDSDDEYEEEQAASTSQLKPRKSDDDKLPPKKKRKRTEGRKRIRKILSQEQLDSETLSAQKEEQERLRRLELQKSLHAVPSAPITPPLVKISPPIEAPEKPVCVDISNKVFDKVIIIDSDDDCDVVHPSHSVSDCVVISDSESDQSDEEDNEVDQEPEKSGSHTNDDVNQPDVHGRVLVNVNHPPSEPDIFLAAHLSGVVKPHQVWHFAYNPLYLYITL